MSRFFLPTVMNLMVPGTGLIALGQPWLGLALSVWFGLAVELSLGGWLIAPAVIPTAWIAGGLCLAVAAWGLGLALLLKRIRLLADPNLSRELETLRVLATEELGRGNFRAARSALTVALAIDADDLEARLLWARLMSDHKPGRKARRAWREVARLDDGGEHLAETQEGLSPDS